MWFSFAKHSIQLLVNLNQYKQNSKKGSVAPLLNEFTEILDSPKSRAQSFPEHEARAGEFFMFYAAKASERAGVRKKQASVNNAFSRLYSLNSLDDSLLERMTGPCGFLPWS